MADACWRASIVTGDRAWLRGVAAAADWFDGANDAGAVMCDADVGRRLRRPPRRRRQPQPGRRVDARARRRRCSAPRPGAVAASRSPLVVTDTGIELTPDPVPGRHPLLRARPRGRRPRRLARGAGDRPAPRARRAEVVDGAAPTSSDRFAAATATSTRPSDAHAHARDAAASTPAAELSHARPLLLGASFTHEYAIEGAALCNPSIVLHPEQPGDGDVAVRPQRARHRRGSPLVDRVPHRHGRRRRATVDHRRRRPVPAHRAGTPGSAPPRRAAPRSCAERDDDRENAAFVLDALPTSSTTRSSTARLDALAADVGDPAAHRDRPIAHLRRSRPVARTGVEFPPRRRAVRAGAVAPRRRPRSHGMEDARFVAITDGERAAPTTPPTRPSTARNVTQHLLTTDDFRTFTRRPMAGAAAGGKGLALFPRQIGGRYAALSRADRETNSVAFSDDLRCWDDVPDDPGPGADVGDPAARQLRLADRDRRTAGSCSPTASARCAPTRSAPSCSTSTIRARVLALARADPDARHRTAATATSRTSSTRAARSPTATGSCSPTASAISASRSPPSRSTSSSAR